MGNLFLIFFFKCVGCCAGACAGHPTKCNTCEPPPPTAPIDDFLYIFLIAAIIYGTSILFKSNSKKTT